MLCCGLVRDKNFSFCHVPQIILQIKHFTIEVVLSRPSFFSKSNTSYEQLLAYANIEPTVYSFIFIIDNDMDLYITKKEKII